MKTERYSEEGFNEFLQELIDNKRLNNSKEEGIAKLVIEKGFEVLSEKQRFVFEKAISPFIYDECKRCGLEILWCEMSAAEDNGRLCSWCQQMSRKDD